jgi:hypothetical protein
MCYNSINQNYGNGGKFYDKVKIKEVPQGYVNAARGVVGVVYVERDENGGRGKYCKCSTQYQQLGVCAR